MNNMDFRGSERTIFDIAGDIREAERVPALRELLLRFAMESAPTGYVEVHATTRDMGAALAMIIGSEKDISTSVIDYYLKRLIKSGFIIRSDNRTFVRINE